MCDSGIRLTLTVGGKTTVHEGDVDKISKVLKKAGQDFREEVKEKFGLTEESEGE